MATGEHFKGCHPEHERANGTAEGHQPSQEPETCWHCETLTDRGCDCSECWDNADDVPPDVVYHCPTCGRWWAYMYPRITTITFNAPAGD